jgi:hypothetical protein
MVNEDRRVRSAFAARTTAPRQRLRALRLDERAHVDHLDQLGRRQCLQRIAAQAQLHRAARQLRAIGGVIRIPLQQHVGIGDGALPVLLRGLQRCLEGRLDGLAQQAIEEGSADPQAQRDLLARLRAPSRAVHHPQEIRLDPAHAVEAEVGAAELSVCDRVAARRLAIGLVHDDGVGVEMREDVFALSGPALRLQRVEFVGNAGLRRFGSVGHLSFSS